MNELPPTPLWQRRVVIMGALFLVLVVLAGIGIWVWLALSSPEGQSLLPFQGNLPNASPAAAPSGAPTPVPSDFDLSVLQGSPIPFGLPTPDAAIASNLKILVHYQRAGGFSLKINDVTRTAESANIHFYAPPSSAVPHSVLRVRGPGETVLFEQRFVMTTEVLAESLALQGGPYQPLETNFESYIVPIPAGSLPVGVDIFSSAGTLLDQRPVDFGSLPVTLMPSAPKKTVWDRIAGLFSLNRWARAQSGGGNFKIVVINELGAQDRINGVISELALMRDTIEPWNTFTGQISIVSVPNNQSLGCVVLNGTFPYCIPTLATSAVESGGHPDWNAIIIATNAPCNCGTVLPGPGPAVVNAGAHALASLLVHELGHAVADMRDEYTSLAPNGQRIEPNCFESQGACTEATADYPGSECALGCLTSDSWRTSSRIMYNVYSPLEFGPFNLCIMGRSIASVIGTQFEGCPDDASPTPPPDIGDDYFGWHR